MADSGTVGDQDGIMEVTAPDNSNDAGVPIVDDGTMQGEVVGGVGEDAILQQALDDVSGTFEEDDTVQIQYTAEGVALEQGQFLTAGEEGVAFITSDGIVSGSDVQLVQNYDGSTYQVVNSVEDLDENVALQIVNMGTDDGETVMIEPNGDGPQNAMYQVINTAPNQMGTVNSQVLGIDSSSPSVPVHTVTGNSYEENLLAAQTITDTGQQYQIMTPKPAILNYAQTVGNLGVTSSINQSSVIQSQPIVSTSQRTPKTIPLLVNQKPSAPLGSSTNPIRIIQQGNQYTPVQNLSQSQLQQIMQVVQQQQVAKSENESSVLYNSQTNTRIVYRVVYPSDLHKDGTGSQLGVPGQPKTKLMEKRTYRKRAHDDDEERMADWPELSKEEKEQRKKMRPKTRSGRVSKPPKHMLKDFKHIHVLDYDEDYDDSDGGYSDFKVSDDETTKGEEEAYITPGLSSIKAKNHKCNTCNKAYIGRGGLCRHLRLFPDHGHLDPEDENSRDSNSIDETPPKMNQTDGHSPVVTSTECMATSTPVTNGQITTGVKIETPETQSEPHVSNGHVSAANSATSFSEDSRDSTSSLHFSNTTPRRRGRGRARGRPPNSARGGRGRGGVYRVDTELRRRNKLRDIAQECTDEELMEIVLPRLARVITLWEFLLMRVNGGQLARPDVGGVYTEYEKLHERVQQLCQKYLDFVPESENNKDLHSVQVESPVVAEALGLKVGRHIVRDIQESETLCEYKFLTTDKSLKRTVEVVLPSEMVSPTKRPKLVSPEIRRNFESTLVKIMPKAIIPQTTSAMLAANINKNLNSFIKITPKVAVSTSTPIVESSASCTGDTGKPSTASAIPCTPNMSLPSNVKIPHIVNTGNSFQGVSTISSPSSSAFRTVAPVTFKTELSYTSPPKQHIALPKTIVVSGKSTDLSMDVNPSASRLNAINNMAIPVTNSTPTNVVNSGSVPGTLTESKAIVSLPRNSAPLPSMKPDARHKISTKPPVISVFPTNSLLNGVSTLESASLPSSTVFTAVTASACPVELPPPSVPVMSNLPPGAVILNTLTPEHLMEVGASNGTVKLQDLNPQSSEGQKESESVITITVRNGTICSQEEADYQGASNLDQAPSNDTEQETNEQITKGAGLEKSEQSCVEISANMAMHVKNELSESSSTTGMAEDSNNIDTVHTSKVVCESQEPVVTTSTEMMGGAGQAVQYETVAQLTLDAGTINMPATIYQTEEGVFLVQHADGTMIQLQGIDGQSIPLETVQAIMGIDGETQFVTEPGATDSSIVHE